MTPAASAAEGEEGRLRARVAELEAREGVFRDEITRLRKALTAASDLARAALLTHTEDVREVRRWRKAT